MMFIRSLCILSLFLLSSLASDEAREATNGAGKPTLDSARILLRNFIKHSQIYSSIFDFLTSDGSSLPAFSSTAVDKHQLFIASMKNLHQPWIPVAVYGGYCGVLESCRTFDRLA
uniref:Uncharacterized protein n=1 Tax=Ditylenchus dipsaci TaxID=166011 RepID=A0A915CYJ8_9BILA